MEEIKSFKGSKTNYTWIRDADGNEYLCPGHTLQDQAQASQSDLADCVDDLRAGVNPRGG